MISKLNWIISEVRQKQKSWERETTEAGVSLNKSSEKKEMTSGIDSKAKYFQVIEKLELFLNWLPIYVKSHHHGLSDCFKQMSPLKKKKKSHLR